MDPRLKGKKLTAAPVAHPKLTAGPAFLVGLAPDDLISAVVQVATPDYVPDSVRVRARFSPLLFTARISGRQLAAVLDDPAVVKIQPGQPVGASANNRAGVRHGT
jgi:hypothetical protein